MNITDRNQVARIVEVLDRLTDMVQDLGTIADADVTRRLTPVAESIDMIAKEAGLCRHGIRRRSQYEHQDRIAPHVIAHNGSGSRNGTPKVGS